MQHKGDRWGIKERTASGIGFNTEDRNMTIHFKRTLPDHAHIYHGKELVGELTRQPDILRAGSWFYVVHLFDDRRGFVRVHDRKSVREVAEQRIRTCELI